MLRTTVSLAFVHRLRPALCSAMVRMLSVEVSHYQTLLCESTAMLMVGSSSFNV